MLRHKWRHQSLALGEKQSLKVTETIRELLHAKAQKEVFFEILGLIEAAGPRRARKL